MSFQWAFLASFLYCELAVVAILLLPFISPTSWQKVFKSRIAKTFNAGAKYYFNLIICIFGLLFFESVRELRKYATTDKIDHTLPHAADHAHMKHFRSERNFYIAGFALFLWFVIKRLITLLSDCAHEMANSAAVQKQAEGARRHLDTLMANEPKKGGEKASGDASSIAELEKYKRESAKAHEEIDALREQYESSVRDFDKLNEEHRKLQIKLAIASSSESSKDK